MKKLNKLRQSTMSLDVNLKSMVATSEDLQVEIEKYKREISIYRRCTLEAREKINQLIEAQDLMKLKEMEQ